MIAFREFIYLILWIVKLIKCWKIFFLTLNLTLYVVCAWLFFGMLMRLPTILTLNSVFIFILCCFSSDLIKVYGISIFFFYHVTSNSLITSTQCEMRNWAKVKKVSLRLLAITSWKIAKIAFQLKICFLFRCYQIR